MTKDSLRDRHILAVEDEYLLADELRTELEKVGATVIGPVATVKAGLALAEQVERIDGAVLDVNLGGELAFELADRVLSRGAALVLTTGYDASAIPERFGDVPRCEKPVDISKVAKALLKQLA